MPSSASGSISDQMKEQMKLIQNNYQSQITQVVNMEEELETLR